MTSEVTAFDFFLTSEVTIERFFLAVFSTFCLFPAMLGRFPQGQKAFLTLFGLKLGAVKTQKQRPVHCNRVLFRNRCDEQRARGRVHGATHLQTFLAGASQQHVAKFLVHFIRRVFHRTCPRATPPPFPGLTRNKKSFCRTGPWVTFITFIAIVMRISSFAWARAPLRVPKDHTLTNTLT